ncbi:MAG TPA: hypothetical protein VM265_09025 [Sphingomicrobium sp.]|nr:hypothetical protein [Sphingomicrobium sp.]
MIALSLSLALGLALQAQVAAPPPVESEVSRAEAEALLAGCAGRRFETPVETVVDGKVRQSRFKLCGKAGQTDADWARTLQDAGRNVEQSRMPAGVKDQIISALQAELAKLPQAAPAASAAPLPAPVPPPAARPALGAAPVADPPRLSFRCMAARGGVAGPCREVGADSLLLVHADEELKAGSRLRFLRRGDVRGELALAPMARGKSVRVKLPAALCAGVIRSQVEIQLLGTPGGTVARTVGPLDLRC